MISIHTEGLDAVRRRLQEMRERAEDLSPAWEELLDWWAHTNVEQFHSRGARWRTPWPPLAASTRAQKRREGFLADPLVRTTRLRGELTGRPLGVEHIRASEVDAGTDIPYARFHQGGTRRMPPRRLVNNAQIAAEGAAGSVVLSWIMSGEPNVGGTRLER